MKEREIDLITLRVVDYPGLKELRYVEEKTEHDDRHNVDCDTLGNTFCVSEVSVGIWMTHGAVPKISNRKEIVVIQKRLFFRESENLARNTNLTSSVG